LLLFRSKTGEDDGITSSPSSTSATAAGADADLSDDEKARLAAHASLDPSLDTADPTPFAFKPLELAGLLDPKNLDELERLGGLDGLLEGLGADPVRGLDDSGSGNPDEDGAQYRTTWEDRRRVYGENVLPKKKSKSFLQLCWLAFQDKMLVSRRRCAR
jgi:Ca2+-transporting ATPase